MARAAFAALASVEAMPRPGSGVQRRPWLWGSRQMSSAPAGLVVWDVDGTLIPADLRWLRGAVARTYQIEEEAVVFPNRRVHGYTDESIVVDTQSAQASSRSRPRPRFRAFTRYWRRSWPRGALNSHESNLPIRAR